MGSTDQIRSAAETYDQPQGRFYGGHLGSNPGMGASANSDAVQEQIDRAHKAVSENLGLVVALQDRLSRLVMPEAPTQNGAHVGASVQSVPPLCEIGHSIRELAMETEATNGIISRLLSKLEV